MSRKNRKAWRARWPHSAENLRFITWLRDRGSLTARLQIHGRFAVRPLHQGLAVPTLDEAIVLGIRPKRVAWVREVVLLCNDQALVFAHTVLPYRPRGPLTGWLARLGNRSLGALLFADAGFIRGELFSQRLDARHELFYSAADALQLTKSTPKSLWARRSCFRYGAQSVLVTEVFSPVLGDGGKNSLDLDCINP